MKETDKSPQELRDEQSFKLGYDAGYMLARNEPLTAAEINQLRSKEPLIEGMKKGKEAFEKEQTLSKQNKMPDWLKPERAKNEFNDKSHDRFRDKDLEHER